MISVSTLSRRLLITEIFDETFEPPRIATKGLTGLFTALPRKSISFCIRYPTTAVSTYFVTPTLEQCALCAVPKASFTNTSAIDARSLENSSPFFVSSALKRVFSRRITSPSFIASTAALALSPTTVSSAANLTSCPRSSESLLATGAKEKALSGPFGLPRCEQRITLPPSAINFLIVGRAATRRVSSVILSPSNGTLKSHLHNTLLPLTLMSSTDFLLSIINSSKTNLLKYRRMNSHLRYYY